MRPSARRRRATSGLQPRATDRVYHMLVLCLRRIAPLLLMVSALAHGGECRDTLRPLLLHPDPDPASLSAVRALCERAAAGGETDALYQLSFFDLGLGGGWNPEAAIPLIEQAAGAGVPEAQYWLAWQLEEGPLLPDDRAAALSWYERAAAVDHRLALDRLARAYEKGELGLKPDARRALELRARIRRCDEDSDAAAARAMEALRTPGA